MLSLVASLLFGIAAAPAPNCVSGPPATPATSRDTPLHVPIEVVNNHVYVNVCVGDREEQFILDTGAGQSFFDLHVATDLGLRLGSHFRGRGAGAGTIDGAQVENGSVVLAGTTVNVAVTSALDLSRLPAREAHRMDGILGYDFFSRYVVAIDYLREELRLYDRGNFTYSGPGASIPITFAENHPVIETDMLLADGESLHGRFVVDVGSGMALSLTKPFVDANHLRTRVGSTVHRQSGGGVGGPAMADVGRVATLRLGGVEVHNVITQLYGDSAGVLSGNPSWIGNIGGDVLRRFTVYVDYQRRRIIFEPHAGTDEAFEADMSGAAFVVGDDLSRITVDYVVPGSAAAEAGLAAGDSLVAVDGAPLSVKTVIELRKRFRRTGQSIELTVKRGGEMKLITLRTRRMV